MPIVIGKNVNFLPTKFIPRVGQIYPQLRTPAVSYCFVLHFFCTQWQICPFSAFLLFSVFLHPNLMRFNKVEIGRRLLT